MKKQSLKITAYLLLTTLILTACNDWLEEKPYSVVSDNQIEDSDVGADMWAMGVYNGLTRMFIYDEWPRCIEFDCDYVTGPAWAFDEAGAGNFQGATLQVDPAWKLTFELINRANEAIAHVEAMQNTSEKHKKNVLGEMYFLKAWGYFMLVRLYGEIPVYRHSINQDNPVKEPRQPIPAVYEHIIELLNQAKEMLYTNTDASFKQGRVCAGSAASLLAKVYLTIASSAKADGALNVRGGKPLDDDRNFTLPQSIRFNIKQVKGYESFDPAEYYTKSMLLADSVIKQHFGQHELLPYSELWSHGAKRDSREHLFGVHFISGDEQLGALFPSRFCGQKVNGVIPGSGGGLWFGMRDHWYKLFDEERDLRVIDGVFHRWVRESDDKYNAGSYYPNTNVWSCRARGFYINSAKDTVRTYTDAEGNEIPYEVYDEYKDGRIYRSGNGENYLAFVTKYADVSNSSLIRTDGMYPFLRYADVLLIYAEAANEVNRVTDEAMEAYNAVRRRSGAAEKTKGSLTQTSFRTAIIEERAMEFAMEAGDRRMDLIRLGIYLEVMNAITGLDEINILKTREEKHLLFPIPQDEMLTNTAITKNNPGWN
jgi:hypothetical protein